MPERQTQKRIAAAAVQALKEALTYAYWYKSDLKSFLGHTITDSSILSRLNWNEYKRNIVGSLVDYLASHEDLHQRQLLHLMIETANVHDFSHLARLEDGESKVRQAKAAIRALREQMSGHLELVREEQAIEERRVAAQGRLMQTTATKNRLSELVQEYLALLSSNNPQTRGFRLEKILRSVFELFELDPKASFRVVGEQIDGAFTFESTDYLLEAKWHQAPVSAADLDVLAGKLSRKLDNTLGLFVSINGFSPDGVAAHSSGRRVLILMDGADLMAVLEDRIDLLQLLMRKRRSASQTGNIYLNVHDILTGQVQ